MWALPGASPPPLKNVEEVAGRYVYWTQTDERGMAVKLLGRGTYGSVYLGKDKKTGQLVAVKVTTTNEQHLFKHIDNELKISKDLNHPNLVRCLETEVRKTGLNRELTERDALVAFAQPHCDV